MPNLCQSDRHFLAFSDTTRNERHHKSNKNNSPTCEKQTHILSEENNGLDKTVNLITISRDLPFAQKRFAKEANIENIQFLSDYRSGEFGTRTGLLIEENRLLARAIIVLDRTGTIRYLEIVKELRHLPDMGKAFIAASSL